MRPAFELDHDYAQNSRHVPIRIPNTVSLNVLSTIKKVTRGGSGMAAGGNTAIYCLCRRGKVSVGHFGTRPTPSINLSQAPQRYSKKPLPFVLTQSIIH